MTAPSTSAIHTCICTFFTLPSHLRAPGERYSCPNSDVTCERAAVMAVSDSAVESVRKAVESLRGFDEDLASVRIVLQGPTVVLAQSDEQVMDLLRGGQGVLSMVLELEPLQNTITEAVQLAFPTDTDGTSRAAAR